MQPPAPPSFHRLWLVAIALASARSAVAVAAPPDEWRPTEALVLEGTSQGGRVVVSPDRLLAAWATGRFEVDPGPDAATRPGPAPGAPLPGRDVPPLAWRTVAANADGAIPPPRDGWAWFEFAADEAYDAILEPGASGTIILNGEPRAGDGYALGHLEHPFRVRAGRNVILMRGGRGNLKPVVRPAEQPVRISSRDRTMPHVRAGEAVEAWAGLVVVNASPEPLAGASARSQVTGGDRPGPIVGIPMPTIPPYATAKIPFRISTDQPAEGERLDVRLAVVGPGGGELAVLETGLRVRRPSAWIKRTFISPTDASVQYYALRASPGAAEALAAGDREAARRGLIVSLHGASVEAAGQIPHYRPRDWAHVVAATNRRPYGFDWEDWGRRDLLEVMAEIERRFPIDPARVHLTGHSMGGHGTWINGLMDAGRYASIAPSSGWATFWTYGQRPRTPADATGVAAILRRADNVSDTLLLLDNAAMVGIYVLHAQADRTVPVREARAMRAVLGEFHTDWAYYERPGAGHWWGSPCLDWPPMMAFLEDHVRPATPRAVDFTVLDPHLPGITWPGVEVIEQVEIRQPSRVRARVDRREDQAIVAVTTENAARIAVDLQAIAGGDPGADAATTAGLEVDGETVAIAGSSPVHLHRAEGGWSRMDDDAADAAATGPRKSERLPSGFKGVFAHRAALVLPTGGDADETAWAAQVARLHAETFRYRGNGRLDIHTDAEWLALDPPARAGRNVVLYGTADSNRAWSTLLPSRTPFDVRPGRLRIGDRGLDGADAALFAVHPSADGARMIGVIAATGPGGRRTAAALRIFLSGAHLPDWTVVTPAVLSRGRAAITGAGFLAADWSYDPRAAAWTDPPEVIED